MTCERGAAAALGLTLLLATGRCGGYAPGIEVRVALQAQAPTLGFDTDRGVRVHLEEAVVRVASVRLVACSPTVGALLQAGLSSVAYAHHVDTSPDQGEGAAPLDLLHANGVPIPVTTLRPPPGRYCQVQVGLGPPEDAPDAPAVSLSGATEAGASFRYASPAVAQVFLPINPPVVLSAEQMQVELTVLVDQRRWLDGQDLAAPAALDPATLRHNITRSLRLRIHEVTNDAS